MGNSFFHFKTFSIYRQEKGLRLTTDACLLGAMADQAHARKCLDIGTGSGVLALMLAQKQTEALITAIEINPEVAAQAAYNIEHSVFRDRINLIHADFLDYKADCLFDLIVSNPPYFPKHLKGKDPHKNTALHADTLSMDSLLSKAAALLSPGGSLWMVYPPQEAESAIAASSEHGLCASQTIRIFNKPGKHFRTILCFIAGQCPEMSETALTMYAEDGSKTEAFYRLMKPFYLENSSAYRRSKN